MPRPPQPLREDRDKRLRVELDTNSGKWWHVDPFDDDYRVEICGFLLPDGSRCIRPISENCNHTQIIEKYVDADMDNNVLDIFKQILDVGEVETKEALKESIELAKQIGREDLSNLDTDIRMAYAMLYLHLRKTGATMDKNDQSFVMNILHQIVKAKEIQAKLVKTSRLDDKSVTDFVLEIFGVLRSELKKDDYKRVVQAIYDRVITPRTASQVIGNKVVKIDDAEVVS